MIQPSDLILVNHHGDVQVSESGPNTLLNKAAFMIHSAVHAARPDVHCAAHSHSVYGRAFSALGKELDMLTQDSCAFYNVRSISRCSHVFAEQSVCALGSWRVQAVRRRRARRARGRTHCGSSWIQEGLSQLSSSFRILSDPYPVSVFSQAVILQVRDCPTRAVVASAG